MNIREPKNLTYETFQKNLHVCSSYLIRSPVTYLVSVLTYYKRVTYAIKPKSNQTIGMMFHILVYLTCVCFYITYKVLYFYLFYSGVLKQQTEHSNNILRVVLYTLQNM